MIKLGFWRPSLERWVHPLAKIAQVWHHLTSTLFHNSVGAISDQGIPLTNLSFHFDLYETCSNILRYHTRLWWILGQRGNPRKIHVPRRNHSETHFSHSGRSSERWWHGHVWKRANSLSKIVLAIRQSPWPLFLQFPQTLLGKGPETMPNNLKVKAIASDRRAYLCFFDKFWISTYCTRTRND